tara:strand:- start:142 stop:288 length:147 start_codon:yes stop_codon:yes gene_type:complete
MKKKINESIQFLFLEFKRLKIKEEKKIISKVEKSTLNKLRSFLGKNKK